MRVAILGGTFNPIHLGHMHVAAAVRRMGYDTVLFVPTNVPSHKETAEMVTAGHRLRMVQLAIGDDPHFAADDREIRRGGVSYSVDTVSELVAERELDAKPALVVGDDLLADFELWRDIQLLLARADLLIAHRHSAERLLFAYRHRYLDNALFPVSSTAIRQAARQGRDVENLVPLPVGRYVEEQRLYR
jgi:nicotinate-nucleotide adenylyltransferase